MDCTSLFKNNDGKRSKIGIIGTTCGYGYTLSAQILKVESVELGLISSRHTNERVEVLTGSGYRKEDVIICGSKEQIQSAPSHGVPIVNDYRLVLESDITTSVECTGDMIASSEVSVDALKKRISVYMISKETDSMRGPILNNIAEKHNTVYSPVNGDQPRNLLDLYSWRKVLGLEIIAAGKANEYDFIWGPDTNEFTYMENPEKPRENIPGLKEFWRYEGPGISEGRRKLLEKYMIVTSAGLYEIDLVSNATELVSSGRRLNYPIVKINELTDIFIPEEDGDILKKTGAVDVFCNLCVPGEASFVDSEFIIVRCENETVQELLTSKGHVVSHSGKYARVYLLYHYMGLETLISVLLGGTLGLGTHSECRQASAMADVTREDMPRGIVLKVQGHHHSTEGLVPKLREPKDTGDAAPFYSLSSTALLKDVKAGQPVTKNMMGLLGSLPYELYNEGLRL